MDYSIWPWKVVIPSYNRADYINKATLEVCIYYKIPESLIYIFIVNDPIQINLYKTSLIKYTDINIIYGPLGLKNMRNFITAYFNEDTPLLCMDDDIMSLHCLCEDITITDIKKASHWKLEILKPNNFYNWTMEAYKLMKTRNLRLFGIYPVKNGFFMKDLPSITYDARFCVGAFWGVLNTKDDKMQITLEEKEDMERSILYTIHDGGILRFNTITLSTKYYKTPGGMQTHQTNSDRIQNSINSSIILYNRYPTICKLYYGKKNGMCEIRFNKKCNLTTSNIIN